MTVSSTLSSLVTDAPPLVPDLERGPSAASSTRRKVIFLGTAHDNGGSSILAGDVAQAMRTAGHTVEEWYLFGLPDAKSGRRVFHQGPRSASPLLLAGLFVQVTSALRAQKPYVVFGLQSLSNLMAGVCGMLAGVPHRVATHHNPAGELNPMLMRLDALAGRSGIYTRMVACAQSVADSYQRGGVAYAKRLTVIPNGQRAPKLVPRLEARRALGLPCSGPIFGQIGRLSPQKNQMFSLDLVAGMPDVTLLLLGSGPDETALRAAVAQRGLTERVRYLAALDHARIGEFYSAIDAALFPSRFEGLSLAAIEAIHAGVPVLCSDIPSFREMFADSPWLTQTIVLPLDRPDLWRTAARDLLTDPGLAPHIVQAFSEVAERFSFETMARSYLALLDEQP